ncbi:MAG: UbiA family prenyltransferase [Oligoflexia bacterium]|nr:UbiA family prenyltransferase [Oligoflexia bacterium]
MFKFLRFYIKSMRLYYSFITGMAGWIGVSYYQHIYFKGSGVALTIGCKEALVLFALFMSWGLNQIINDYLGLPEDRINAPHRPMVTGDLNSKWALILSFAIMIFISILCFMYLEKLSLIPLVAGVFLNVLYEKAKAHGIWGNIVFGITISMTSVFGFLAIGPLTSEIFSPYLSSILSIWFMVILINAVMTYYTYFKDYDGDKDSGVKTLVVLWGIERASFIGIFLSFLPALAFFLLLYFKLIDSSISSTTTDPRFIFLALLTLFLQVWNGFLYYHNPVGPKAYHSLEINFKSCSAAFVTLIAFVDPMLAMYLYISAYVFIEFLFKFHSDHKG